MGKFKEIFPSSIHARVSMLNIHERGLNIPEFTHNYLIGFIFDFI